MTGPSLSTMMVRTPRQAVKHLPRKGDPSLRTYGFTSCSKTSFCSRGLNESALRVILHHCLQRKSRSRLLRPGRSKGFPFGTWDRLGLCRQRSTNGGSSTTLRVCKTGSFRRVPLWRRMLHVRPQRRGTHALKDQRVHRHVVHPGYPRR